MAIFNNNQKATTNETPSVNLIGTGTTITGDVICNGDIRIDGGLIGNLNAKGKVIIGSTGKVEGNIQCQNSDLFGQIKGNIQVQELLSLKATANITGDISTNKLSIEPGANFTGNCSMGAMVKDIKNATIERTGSKAEKIA
jgi:cytoskeletal protein CcmA (bactofilin family)